ncbi:MAG: hypothetical protein V4693_17885 [Pseudomonadota bacterium]
MNSPFAVSARSARLAAFAIASTALLVMVALFHHPVISHAADARDAHLQIVQLRSANNLVHGALIALLVVLASALAAFGKVIGERRPAASWALVAYCLGCGLLSVAMLLDGFVMPRLAAQFVSAQSSDPEVGMLIMRVIGAVIQVFSNAGFVAHCVAMLAWSAAAATGPQALPGSRWCAAIGAAAALLPAVLILFTDLQLTRHSLMLIFTAHTAWYLTAAWLLYRFSIASSSVVRGASACT